MRKQILEATETNPDAVAKACLGVIPEGKRNFYMKHMPHHMVDGFPFAWSSGCTNVHLIRHPARVVASYLKKREAPTLEDIGFKQQLYVFKQVGGIVIDSFDVRMNPERSLRGLCKAIQLPFDKAMLSWPKGGHKSDGVWAAHWYGSVHKSTAFAGPEGPLPDLSGDAAALVAAAQPYYDALAEHKLPL